MEIIGMGMYLDKGRNPSVLSLIVRKRFLRGTAPTDAEILHYMVSRGYVPDEKRLGKFYTPDRRGGYLKVLQARQMRCTMRPPNRS